MEYRYETHFHTDEVSYCGTVPAAEAVKAYCEQGYTGITVTDHYYGGLLRDFGGNDNWEAAVDRWMLGYRLAKEAGDACGLDVFLGMELRFEGSPEDYLVYGIDRQFLLDHPKLYDLKPDTFSVLAKEYGLYFGQAHPYRPGLKRCDPTLIDGVEGFNGNKRHNSHDAQAQAFGKDNGLIITSGADFHEWEDLARGGMVSSVRVENETHWVELLKSGVFLPDLSLTRPEEE